MGNSLTYSDVNGFGTVTSAAVMVTDGRFMPCGTVVVEGEPITFTGASQFGGMNQRGVVGYVGGYQFRSVFYGDRDH